MQNPSCLQRLIRGIRKRGVKRTQGIRGVPKCWRLCGTRSLSLRWVSSARRRRRADGAESCSLKYSSQCFVSVDHTVESYHAILQSYTPPQHSFQNKAAHTIASDSRERYRPIDPSCHHRRSPRGPRKDTQTSFKRSRKREGRRHPRTSKEQSRSILRNPSWQAASSPYRLTNSSNAFRRLSSTQSAHSVITVRTDKARQTTFLTGRVPIRVALHPPTSHIRSPTATETHINGDEFKKSICIRSSASHTHCGVSHHRDAFPTPETCSSSISYPRAI